MRTVTFSDKEVAESVNKNFVAAWYNRGAGFHNEEFQVEKHIFRRSMEAYTTRNICTFFLTPDGKVFHYVSGYFSPEMFLSILDVAIKIRRGAFDENMKLKKGGAEIIAEIHDEAYASIKAKATRAKAALRKDADGWKNVVKDVRTETYRDVKHSHSEQCARAILHCYRYLSGLHDHWRELKKLPSFDEIRFKYLWGDSFSEEPRRGAKEIGGRSCVND